MYRSRAQAITGIEVKHFIPENGIPYSIPKYQSEVKYDVREETDHIHGSDEESMSVHDYSTDSDCSLEPSPQPAHPSLTQNNSSLKYNHMRHQSFSISMTLSMSKDSFVVRSSRPRSQTTKPRLNSQSFNHYHINSITIHTHFTRTTNHDSDDEKSITDSTDTDVGDEHKNEHAIIEPTTEHSKCKIIEQEIVESEETYFRGLNLLLNELIIPMFKQHLMDKKYYKHCVSNLPQLLAFHGRFLGQMHQVYSDNIKSISQVFSEQNKEEFIHLYLKYIRDYDSILELFGNTLHKNTKLQMFLKQKRKEKKPLTNFLILPVQRITRYVLLWTDLKKHTQETNADYMNIAAALALIEEITNEINERKKRIEDRTQCLQIQEALSNLAEPIVKPGRAYLKQFVFVKKSNKHQRQFFCFNDIIIVTNSSWQVKAIIDIRTVEIKIQPPKLKKKASSFGLGSLSKSKENEQNQTTGFAEFILLYWKVKPCCYVSRTMDDVHDFERMIKHNRLMLIDRDLAQQSGTSEIRDALRQNGVSQAEDYEKEIASIKTKRKRGNATADMHIYLATPCNCAM
eukprot:68399_1